MYLQQPTKPWRLPFVSCWELGEGEGLAQAREETIEVPPGVNCLPITFGDLQLKHSQDWGFIIWNSAQQQNCIERGQEEHRPRLLRFPSVEVTGVLCLQALPCV